MLRHGVLQDNLVLSTDALTKDKRCKRLPKKLFSEANLHYQLS